MKITIRQATEEDFDVLIGLVNELADFVRGSGKVTNTAALMREESDSFSALVAETESGEIAGMAVYSFVYFTWVGKSLYLDDLYVREQYRKMKIGSRLLDSLFAVARNKNCKRVRWQVLKWNNPAIEFYRKCGAAIDEEHMNCDFGIDDIRNFHIEEP